MADSPCDRTCVLQKDVDGTNRCISCLRTGGELNWNNLPEDRKEEIINRERDDFFPEMDYPHPNE